jgi:hypothetical protein
MLLTTLSRFQGEKSTPEEPEDKQVKAILGAKEPVDAAKAYVRLFKSLKVDDLRRLQTNANDTIAIHAAWKQVELTVLKKGKGQEVRPDAEKLNWFLGFLEGRGRLRAPRWWAKAILDARATIPGSEYAGGLYLDITEGLLSGKMPKRRAKEELPAPGATLAEKDGKHVVRIGSVSVPIPDDLPRKLEMENVAHRDDGIKVAITPSSCFIGVHHSHGIPYRLACVDRTSARTRWIVKVWATCWLGASGVDRQQVEVTVQGDRVIVFGISATGFYVEAFRVNDGGNVFRFSNAYSRRLHFPRIK